MIFIIIIIVGIIGMTGTLWLSGARLRYQEKNIPHGQEWFVIAPDKIESAITAQVRKGFRNLLKVILVWLLGWYRHLAKKITVKQLVKQRVRSFLYDHTPDGVRHPSEFWHRVKHPHPKKPTMVVETEIVEIISETPEDTIENRG